MGKVLLDLTVLAVTFAAGAKYGRVAEQKAIAEIVSVYDNSAAKAIALMTNIRARVAAQLAKL